jgi:type III pantothenate kinase
MQLVVNIGSQKISVGLFESDRLVQTFLIKHPEELLEFLKGKTLEQSLIAGNTPEDAQGLMSLLITQGFPCKALIPSEFKRLATDETLSLLHPDRIANIFGALYHFPSNDCLIVDIGTTVRFDYVTKQGVYLGGAIFPTILTDRPTVVLGKDRFEQEKSGNYFGLLGAIERIVAELRLSSEIPSAVMSIATGGMSRIMEKDLEDFIDKVDPELILIGLNQILKEVKT